MGSWEYLSASSVFLAWSLHMSIASVWYSPAGFNPRCIKLAHNGRAPAPNVRGIAASAVGLMAAIPFFCFVLDAAHCSSALEGCLWGLSFGLFDVGINCSHCFFEDRPFELFLIHRGCHTFSFVAVGTLLGYLCS